MQGEIHLRHNMEVAHRLYELPGKCEAIHGHSMYVHLTLRGEINPKGILEGLAFGDVKKSFRDFLDSTFDHHLLLNENDPWAKPVMLDREYIRKDGMVELLPGLMTFPGDPTTENLATWIASWAKDEFGLNGSVSVEETAVNAATVQFFVGEEE